MRFPFSRQPAVDPETCELKGPLTGSGLRMRVHPPGDIISECIRRFGIWEPAETNYLIAHLRPGDSFVDIGANIGYHSVVAAHLVGETGRVVAFEPDADNFKLLAANVMLNRLSVAMNNAAVSDRDGEAMLYRSADNMGDHRVWTSGNSKGTPIRLTRLAPEMIDARTMMKIDVQGWEAKVIIGNLGTIARARAVMFEFFPRWIAQNGDVPAEIIAVLVQAGFGFQLIDNATQTIAPIRADEISNMIPALTAGSGGPGEPPAFIDLIAERH
jgi:FkbM family methyltransferase